MTEPKKDQGLRHSRPYRPLPIALFNRAGALAERLGASRELDVDRLVASARRKAGLTDFGDDWFMEPLRVLVSSINREANLNPLGRLVQAGRLQSALVTRLRVQQLLRDHPEILDVDLGKIIFIAGLQRTGTTTLHRLLAADPRMRSLLSWEALNPLPLPHEKPGDPRQRIRYARWAEKGLAYLAPQFFAIHPVEHDAPEEDVLLLDLCFMSQTAEAILNVPSYASWLEQQDHTRAYQYLRTMLQVLTWLRPAQHWVLKSPHHMEYLDVIMRVFPGAYIVQTHRDPQKTTGSFCSMVWHGRGVFSDAVDAGAVAQHWMRKVDRLMRRSIAVRSGGTQAQFLDVSYYDLLRDPTGEVKRIYDLAHIPFDQAAAESTQRTSERNIRDRYGKHVYRLQDFDLTPALIEKQFGYYRERYAVPHEQ